VHTSCVSSKFGSFCRNLSPFPIHHLLYSFRPDLTFPCILVLPRVFRRIFAQFPSQRLLEALEPF
jgi:hypothetical protein